MTQLPANKKNNQLPSRRYYTLAHADQELGGGDNYLLHLGAIGKAQILARPCVAFRYRKLVQIQGGPVVPGQPAPGQWVQDPFSWLVLDPTVLLLMEIGMSLKDRAVLYVPDVIKLMPDAAEAPISFLAEVDVQLQPELMAAPERRQQTAIEVRPISPESDLVGEDFVTMDSLYVLGAELDRLKRGVALASLPTPVDTSLLTRLNDSSKDELQGKSRNTAQKLIIGMAIKKYGYNPIDKKSTKTSLIAQHLDELGIGLDVDTIKSWLKEGAKLLPGHE